MKSKDLANQIEIANANLNILKSEEDRAIRFSTLEAICMELDCQPGDLLEVKKEPDTSLQKKRYRLVYQ